MQFRYITTPAALWAGPIEKAEFRIRWDLVSTFRQELTAEVHKFECTVEPTGYEYAEGEFRWSYRDWEPSVDIKLALDSDSEPWPRKLPAR